MNKNKTVQSILITTSIAIALGFTYSAQAEVFKWRDNKGVIQYSDTPPPNSMKATPSEIVNSLQKKDLCAPTVAKNVVTQKGEPQQSFFANIFTKSTNLKSKTTSAQTTSTPTSTNTTKFRRVATTKTATPTSNKQLTTTQSKTGMLGFLTNGTNFKDLSVLGFNKNKIKPPTVSPTPVISPTPTAPIGSETPPPVVVVVSPTPVPTPVPTPAPVIVPEPLPVISPTPIPVAEPIPVEPPPPTPTPVVSPTPIPTPIITPTPIEPITNPNLIQVGLQPMVDISQNIVPAIGHSVIRTFLTSEIAPPSGGEFRIGCGISHMSNDDPLIFPNQQGAAHHHTFFGNTSINFKSNLEILNSVGNSTCSGGIMNRSAYWVPSMINTATNAPIAPNGNVLVYYKSGAIDGTLITAPPKGLRIIAGNSKAIDSATSQHSGFTCHPGPNSPRTSWPRAGHIPSGTLCEPGDDLMMSVFFPQCWDGKNLDSPNHKDHMAYPLHRTNQLPNFYCPTTHPIAIPHITVNVHFTIKPGDDLTKWRLASDNYQFNGANGGYSSHSDYVEGWDRPSIEGIVKNCLNAKVDAHAHLLCDGRGIF